MIWQSVASAFMEKKITVADLKVIVKIVLIRLTVNVYATLTMISQNAHILKLKRRKTLCTKKS